MQTISNGFGSPEVGIPFPNPHPAHKRTTSRTRNNKIHQYSRTENDKSKTEGLNWISDPKNNTNDFQNYLTEFKDIKSHSSIISSPYEKPPSEFETFDIKNNCKNSRKPSLAKQDSEILNKILSQDQSNYVFNSWRQQNRTLQSKLRVIFR